MKMLINHPRPAKYFKTARQGKKGDYQDFLKVIEAKFLKHSIVLQNRYTQWFGQGTMTLEELRHFTVQFSVFSNFFLVAQLKKMINAETVESMRSAKEILANEIGVMFKDPKIKDKTSSVETATMNGEPMGITGSVDGGTFRFAAGHFEWLLHFARPLDLGFQDLGKRRHGTPSTLFFCDQLDHFYGHEDPIIASGASFAIENWAAAGFWEELISGLKQFREHQGINIPLGFFTWHSQLEAQHAHHTQDELKEIFYRDDFDKEKFLQGGLKILEALSQFWNGLERDRICGMDLCKRKIG